VGRDKGSHKQKKKKTKKRGIPDKPNLPESSETNVGRLRAKNGSQR